MSCVMSAFKHHNNLVTKLTLLVMAAAILPTLAMPYVWLNVRSVAVETDFVENITVTADRTIITNFLGDFRVEVRDKFGGFICQGAPTTPFVYLASKSKITEQNPEANILSMSLEKWLGGKADLDECVRQGMQDDIFSLNNCHMKVLFGINIARRCVPSNQFGVVSSD